MGRSGASIGAPGAMLNATCRLVVRQRSMAMDPWILDPQTAGETHKFLESMPLSFLRAGPPKSIKKIAKLLDKGQGMALSRRSVGGDCTGHVVPGARRRALGTFSYLVTSKS